MFFIPVVMTHHKNDENINHQEIEILRHKLYFITDLNLLSYAHFCGIKFFLIFLSEMFCNAITWKQAILLTIKNVKLFITKIY